MTFFKYKSFYSIDWFYYQPPRNELILTKSSFMHIWVCAVALILVRYLCLIRTAAEDQQPCVAHPGSRNPDWFEPFNVSDALAAELSVSDGESMISKHLNLPLGKSNFLFALLFCARLFHTKLCRLHQTPLRKQDVLSDRRDLGQSLYSEQ